MVTETKDFFKLNLHFVGRWEYNRRAVTRGLRTRRTCTGHGVLKNNWGTGVFGSTVIQSQSLAARPNDLAASFSGPRNDSDIQSSPKRRPESRIPGWIAAMVSLRGNIQPTPAVSQADSRFSMQSGPERDRRGWSTVMDAQGPPAPPERGFLKTQHWMLELGSPIKAEHPGGWSPWREATSRRQRRAVERRGELHWEWRRRTCRTSQRPVGREVFKSFVASFR
jgi:hypothetical protein